MDMWNIIQLIFRSLWFIFKIAWLPVLLWAFELRIYLPDKVQKWLSENYGMTFWGAIIGTAIWIGIGIYYELPRFRDVYHKLYPQIKFVVTNHVESGQFEIIDNKHVLVGIALYVEGYFENEGGVPSTVKAIEAQLIRKYGIFRLPMSKKCEKAAYYLQGGRDLIDYRGCHIEEYSVSAKVKADATCFFNNKFQVEKLGQEYYFKVKWRVLGQEPKEIEIYPNWDGFKKDVENWLSRPIPESDMFKI
jgi:hypothetical protein